MQRIEAIKKKYHKQWLLIAVNEIDASTTTPLTGKLIAHSPYRDKIYQKLFLLPHKQNILIEYSEDTLPKGYAAAF